MNGFDRFVAEWKRAIDYAAAAEKHHLVARHYCAIANLISCTSEIEERHVREMSDDELNEATFAYVVQTIQDHPILAVHAAARLGWRVEPPVLDDSEETVCEGERHECTIE